MANYDFSTLNSTDLEELACDLLNADLPSDSKISYKTFKDGKDQGIDFLYSTNTCDVAHVGQVKHYYRTGYPGMFSHLKATEVEKVKKLKPKKYIFVTSVDLSTANTRELKEMFTPFIKSLNDIYGKKDINRLIDKHEKILENHYKLWLSDTSILRLILNSQLQFRSNDMEEELKKKLRLYVETPIFKQAQESLNNNKFIIISGNPGVGKTTLAEMLAYEYIAKEYRLSYVYDVDEAEREIIRDNSKQIIYFDDFLGSNIVEINNAKGSELRLMALLRRIPKMENKLMIFTTRTYLLNSAILESEKLKQFGIKAKTSLFELIEYDKDLRKQLVINHIEDTELSPELKEVLCADEIINFIIESEHFTPRSVEFITSHESLSKIPSGELKKFVFANFNKPDLIWEHAYTRQITEDDRLLLNTLISFGNSANLKQLEKAFLKRYEYEVLHNNRTKDMYTFKNALARLEQGFISIINMTVKLSNHSLEDFLVAYIKKDLDEVNRIVMSITYTSQLTTRLFSMARLDVYMMPNALQERLINEYTSFLDNSNSDYDLIQLALVISRYVQHPHKDDILCEIIGEITDFEALSYDYSLNSHFKEFIANNKENIHLMQAIGERISEILEELVKGEDDISDATRVLTELVNNFEVDLSTISTYKIMEHFDELFTEHISQEMEWLKDYMTDKSEVDEKLREIRKQIEEIQDTGLDYDPDLSEFDIDWYEIAWANEWRRIMEKDD